MATLGSVGLSVVVINAVKRLGLEPLLETVPVCAERKLAPVVVLLLHRGNVDLVES